MGRVASGVTGVKFKLDGDYVVGMAVVPSLPEDTDEDDGSTGVGPELLVVSNGGMGKRSFVSKYRKTRRGAKGVRNINLAEGESVVAALLVEPGDELIITTTLAQTVRIPVDEVRTVGRASKGVRIMRFKKDGDEITGVAKVVKVEADGDDGESSGEDAENADGGAVNANIAEAAAPGKENPSVEESGAEKKNTGDSEDSNPDESNA
jgi:DNA gyrase subunit A